MSVDMWTSAWYSVDGAKDIKHGSMKQRKKSGSRTASESGCIEEGEEETCTRGPVVKVTRLSSERLRVQLPSRVLD